jgi:DNA-binding winged helix-turn-helix (wHTH) protein/pSer/pThr/pTyr-binding forkhead associated (FHA) protein
VTPLRIAFGDHELDEARFELRQGGRLVVLQPKVLDLIIYLARHRERVVSKDELLDVVWKGVTVTEASLSQALSLARRAVGDTFEAQHTLRTVRGKGFQFVAALGEPGTRKPAEPAPPPFRTGATALETAEDDAPRSSDRAEAAYLFAALHCETPRQGGAGWSLADVDEVHVVRGSERRSERSGGLTRLLTIAIPGKLVSRRHARIVKSPAEWLVVDESSRNGTFVNGERVESRGLRPGDVVACGKTLFSFTHEPKPADVDLDADSRAVTESLLGSVTPRLRALERDLRRIATSDLPVTIAGESGVGKTHVARGLHGLSGRRGSLVRLDAATLGPPSELENAFERARHGTVIIESLERLHPELQACLVATIDHAPETRLICTSIAPFATLKAQTSADFYARVAGFRCELPPLRERLGDLGCLAATALAADGAEIDPAAGLALLRHGWPGNIRELIQVLTAAATLAGSDPIRRENLWRT